MFTRLWLVFGILIVTPICLALHQVAEVCAPSVSAIMLNGPSDPVTLERMRVIFDEDQTARTSKTINWEALNREDEARRVEVMDYLRDGKLTTGAGLYYAAFIFQHGNCPEHYKLANRLAAKALELDFDARWLYAATLDRYLLSQGKKQKFGTQYVVFDDCRYVLEPVDPATKDAERARYDVPTLANAKASIASRNAGDCPSTGD